jgi:hypothetical protein
MRSIVLPLTLVMAACGSGGEVTPDANDVLACLSSGLGETYVAGLEHAGQAGRLDFRLMSANPAPPGFNNNTWVIQVSSMAAGVAGNPVDGATITVTPYMPVHQHGTAIRAKVQDMSGGMYQLSPVNLWMPGIWETTISAQVGGVQDTTVYRFCIQP